jgi:rod shape-determining protein MreD
VEKETHSSARVLKIALCLLVAAFAQTTLTRVSRWLGYIDWLLLFTVYVGLLRDPVQALLTGTAAGLLGDAASITPIGVGGMAKVLAAYLAYWVSSKVYVEGAFVRLLTVAGSSMVNMLVLLAFHRLLKFDIPPVASVKSAMMAVAFGVAANLVLSAPFFAALDRVFMHGARQRARRAEAMRGMRRRRWKKMV